jgi:hypothetical protein
MTALRTLLALVLLAGAGVGIARAARNSNTQVHRFNQ